MWDSDAEADARGHGFLTHFDTLRNGVPVLGLYLVMDHELVDQLVNGFPPVLCLEVTSQLRERLHSHPGPCLARLSIS